MQVANATPAWPGREQTGECKADRAFVAAERRAAPGAPADVPIQRLLRKSTATARTKTPVQRDQAAKCHPRYLPPAGRMTGHSRAKRHERQLPAADNGNEAVLGYRLPPATWTCQARCPPAVPFR